MAFFDIMIRHGVYLIMLFAYVIYNKYINDSYISNCEEILLPSMSRYDYILIQNLQIKLEFGC